MFDPSITCGYLLPITRYGYPPPAEQTRTHLEEMRALGFRSVELEGIHGPHLRAVYVRRRAIRRHLEALGLEVSYFCPVLPGLSSADPRERARHLELFEMGCDLAHELGARGVLDNAPIPPYRFPEGLPVVRHYDEDVLRAATLPPELEWDRYWATLVETYRKACDIADAYGLTVQVHPCRGALVSTTEGFLHFDAAVRRENLRFNLDTANLFARGDNLPLALHRLAGRIDYIHLSDNRGDRGEHLVPGDGAIDWDAFFDALRTTGFDGRIGLDIGGAESDVGDLDSAYTRSARWLSLRWPAR